MNRKLSLRFICAIAMAILLISCDDDDNDKSLSPAGLSGIYSNKLSAPANGDSLVLSYNGNIFIGKDVEFKTGDGKTADIILKYVLPHDGETKLENVPLSPAADGYTFSGSAIAATGTTFHYQGSVQKRKMTLELSDITISANQLTANGTWYIAHNNASYYNVDNGNMQTMLGMLYNMIGGQLVGNLISSVLDDITFRPDGNIIANYAPLPDSVAIGDLIGTYVKHPASDWTASPANLATCYAENNSLYVTLQIDMIIRQVMMNKQTKADSDQSAMENAIMAAYQKIIGWSTTGIKMEIRPSSNPAQGDIILLLNKTELQELLTLLPIVKMLIPAETLDAPVMDLIGDMIPPQFAGLAGLLLQGKTTGAILDQLIQELNTIPIEIGIYLYKDKPNY